MADEFSYKIRFHPDSEWITITGSDLHHAVCRYANANSLDDSQLIYVYRKGRYRIKTEVKYSLAKVA
ncbi:MAG: hypothetical protein OEZ19_10120 [Paracoccaceae bacterium]|nr:hypothetical protein [Paracoccaceae bacterium]